VNIAKRDQTAQQFRVLVSSRFPALRNDNKIFNFKIRTTLRSAFRCGHHNHLNVRVNMRTRDPLSRASWTPSLGLAPPLCSCPTGLKIAGDIPLELSAYISDGNPVRMASCLQSACCPRRLSFLTCGPDWAVTLTFYAPSRLRSPISQ
jgi:hypothetical protein